MKDLKTTEVEVKPEMATENRDKDKQCELKQINKKNNNVHTKNKHTDAMKLRSRGMGLVYRQLQQSHQCMTLQTLKHIQY